MKGVSTAFWSIVLIGSTVSIAAGFAGGRSMVAAGALPPPELDSQLPPPINQRILRRTLVGAHSLDAALDEDPYGDPELGVAAHAKSDIPFDPRTDRAKVAVIVIDAGRAGAIAIQPFLKSPLPLTLAVDPADDGAQETSAAISDAGKAMVVDAAGVKPAQVAAFVGHGATGVIASLDHDDAAALMHAVGKNVIVVDAALGEDDAVEAVARASAHRVYTRDVIADARDDASYVDFMFRDALAIAQHTGLAIIAVHARTETLDALARFADRADRDGADLVSLADLGS